MLLSHQLIYILRGGVNSFDHLVLLPHSTNMSVTRVKCYSSAFCKTKPSLHLLLLSCTTWSIIFRAYELLSQVGEYVEFVVKIVFVDTGWYVVAWILVNILIFTWLVETKFGRGNTFEALCNTPDISISVLLLKQNHRHHEALLTKWKENCVVFLQELHHFYKRLSYQLVQWVGWNINRPKFPFLMGIFVISN